MAEKAAAAGESESVVAPARGIQDFLDQKNALGETDEAYHWCCQDELDRGAALLRQHHAHRIEQLRAARAFGAKIAQAARAWAVGLGDGAGAANADDDLASGAMTRALDGRLLSLSLAGFAEIEYGKEKLRRQAEFNQNLTDSLLYFAERRRRFTEFTRWVGCDGSGGMGALLQQQRWRRRRRRRRRRRGREAVPPPARMAPFRIRLNDRARARWRLFWLP
jgi:hypothetical protein